MQAHKKKIKKRIYKAGKKIKISSLQRVKNDYIEVMRTFKISFVKGNEIHGTYTI